MEGLKKFFALITILLSVALSLAIAFFVLIVCLRNTASVNIDLFFVNYTDVPVELAFLANFGVGIVFGFILAFLILFKFRRRRKSTL